MSIKTEEICLWSRIGKPWPNNGENYWRTSCGTTDSRRLAQGECPYCGREIAGAGLSYEYSENTISARKEKS